MKLEVPWAFIPPTLVIDGWLGNQAARLNGEYKLQPNDMYGYPTWAKQSPAGHKVAFILRDYCGAWLISTDDDGRGESCHGWASADARDCGAEPGGRPWDCTGNWRAASRDWDKDPSIFVAPALETASRACTPDDEVRVIQKFGSIDIVIPWINGSDPAWLFARHQTCEDYFWERHWPDAVDKSPSAKRCIQEQGSMANPLDYTFKTSSCFRNFIHSPCVKRAQGIADHGELRYLLRSLERHLWWHTGRIILVVPKEQRPAWLVPADRLVVLSQEELVEAAMTSPIFQGVQRVSRFVPSKIFNDFPIEASLPFLPGVTETIMLLQDDILFARPAKPCELFTRHGLQLFAYTYEPVQGIEEPYRDVFQHLMSNTANLWNNYMASSNSNVTPVPYYRIYHMPQLLNVATLEALWRQWPEEFSASLDSAFRQPWQLDIVGLHHCWVAQRSREERIRNLSKRMTEDSGVVDTVSTSLVIDVEEWNTHEPQVNLQYAVVNYKNVWNFDRQMRELPPKVTELPMTINFQDYIDTADGQTPELDCVREQWSTQVLPDPSSFEDPSMPPSACGSGQEPRKPWVFIPKVLVINGGQDLLLRSKMHGEYMIQSQYTHGQPTWVKKSFNGQKIAYLLQDYCGAWLISPFGDGEGKDCRGWAQAEVSDCGDESGGRPWECTGHWQVTDRDGVKYKDASLSVKVGGRSPHEAEM